MARVAIVGTGGIGGPLGASLAKAGAEVTFLARGAHLAAIRANGLRVEGDRGETLIHPARATDDPASAGVQDFVLLCVKQWDVESAGAAIRPMVGQTTAEPSGRPVNRARARQAVPRRRRPQGLHRRFGAGGRRAAHGRRR